MLRQAFGGETLYIAVIDLFVVAPNTASRATLDGQLEFDCAKDWCAKVMQYHLETQLLDMSAPNPPNE